jgi:hypothetical protein
VRTYPPRLYGGPQSSLDSVEIVVVCRKRLPTTHAAVVSARVGGHGRNDVRIDRNMVGRRLEKPAATIQCTNLTPSSGSTLTVGWQVCCGSRVAVVSCKAARSMRV